jgi:hypothetical protein
MVEASATLAKWAKERLLTSNCPWPIDAIKIRAGLLIAEIPAQERIAQVNAYFFANLRKERGDFALVQRAIR